GLTEADAPVVRRDARVGEDAEAARLEVAHRGVEQERVLEHSAANGHRRVPRPRPDGRAAVARAARQAPVEARRHHSARNTGESILRHLSHEVRAPHLYRSPPVTPSGLVCSIVLRVDALLELDRRLALVADLVTRPDDGRDRVEEPTDARRRGRYDARV